MNNKFRIVAAALITAALGVCAVVSERDGVSQFWQRAAVYTLLVGTPLAASLFLWKLLRVPLQRRPFIDVLTSLSCVVLIHSGWAILLVTDAKNFGTAIQYLSGWIPFLGVLCLSAYLFSRNDDNYLLGRLIRTCVQYPRMWLAAGAVLTLATLRIPMDGDPGWRMLGSEWITSIDYVGGRFLKWRDYDVSGWVLDHFGRAAYLSGLICAVAVLLMLIVRPRHSLEGRLYRWLMAGTLFVSIYATVDVFCGWNNFLLGGAGTDWRRAPIMLLWLFGWTAPALLYFSKRFRTSSIGRVAAHCWLVLMGLAVSLHMVLLGALLPADLNLPAFAAYVTGMQMMAAGYLVQQHKLARCADNTQSSVAPLCARAA